MIDDELALCRRWEHSFEEDADNVRVYRPTDYAFPLTRGRDAIEFRSNGVYFDWVVDRGDANRPILGRWRRESARIVRIDFPDRTRALSVIEIVELTPRLLKIRDVD